MGLFFVFGTVTVGCGGAVEKGKHSNFAGNGGGAGEAGADEVSIGGTTAKTDRTTVVQGGKTSTGTGGESGSGVGRSRCDNYRAKYVECGLLPEATALICPSRFESLDSCVLTCVANKSCADVTELYCKNGSPAELFRACEYECGSSPTFTCGDEVINDETERCNGYEACGDSYDEVGCLALSCRKDGTIVTGQQCDGSEDCEDGSDEVGCLSTEIRGAVCS